MLAIYHLLTVLSVPFLFIYLVVFLWRRKDFRPGFLERLGKVPAMKPAVRGKTGGPACFWLHAVSVGEMMAAVPLARALQSRFPQARLVLSSYTPLGRETAMKMCPDAERVLYFPLDVYPITRSVIARVRPSLFVLVETDIWPGFLHGITNKGIPSVLVNGRVSSRRLLIRPFYRRVLEQISRFCLQTEIDRERLLEIGIDAARTAVTGNMKFAQAAAHPQEASRLRQELGIPPESPLLVAGSTHEGEEEEILRCYHKLVRDGQDIRLLIAPRHPERVDSVEALCRSHGLSCERRSRMNGAGDHSVLLLDTIGELSSVYGLGTFTFVGGSLVRRGGHNLMEPAAWGKAIFFGPHMENYSSIASSLEREGAAVGIRNGEDLAVQIGRLARDKARIAEMGRKAAAFVARNQGAVERNLAVIEELLESRVRR